MSDLITLAPETAWYVARSTGLVAWALVTISVVVGLLQSTKAMGRRPGPAWLRELHAHAGALALSLTAVHVVALLLDTYVDFDLLDVLVPFASGWEPAAVAWGVVGFYLLLAVEGTALARKRLPRGLWLKVHRLAAVTYVLSTAHLLTAGTDASSPALLAAVMVSITAVGGLLLTRIALAGGRRSRVHPAP